MNEKLLKNINHYGVNHQQRKLQEEVFELQEAVSKYQFAEEENLESELFYEPVKWDLYKLKEYIIEELADVMVLLNQFKLYYGISDEEVKEVMIKKIDRQMERIGE